LQRVFWGIYDSRGCDASRKSHLSKRESTRYSGQSHARQVADYGEDRVDADAARAVIGEMARFLGAVESFLKRPKR
jgi:hypothetical protein